MQNYAFALNYQADFGLNKIFFMYFICLLIIFVFIFEAKTAMSTSDDFKISIIAENMYNAMNDLVHIDDLYTQRMVWGNNKSEKILGFTANEIIDKGNEFIQKHYHPDDIKEIPKIIEFFKNNKDKEHTTFFRVKHKDGHWVFFITKRSLYNNDSRYVLSISTIISDNIDCGLNFKEFVKIRTAEENKELIKIFTKREIEILSLIKLGFTNDMIAEKLFISKLTVSTHRNNILRKTKLHNIAELINYAKEIGLI